MVNDPSVFELSRFDCISSNLFQSWGGGHKMKKEFKSVDIVCVTGIFTIIVNIMSLSYISINIDLPLLYDPTW